MTENSDVDTNFAPEVEISSEYHKAWGTICNLTLLVSHSETLLAWAIRNRNEVDEILKETFVTPKNQDTILTKVRHISECIIRDCDYMQKLLDGIKNDNMREQFEQMRKDKKII